MAAQAAITISRGALLWGTSAGVGSLILMNNGDVGKFFKDISRHAVHLLTRPSGDGDGNGNLPPTDDMLHSQLSDQIARLSNEVAWMRSSRGYSSGSSQVNWTMIILTGGAAATVMYLKGVTFGDIMYVTKKHFEETVDKLKDGVAFLTTALEDAKNELGEKIGIVESKVEHTRVSLEQKIEMEVGDLKRDIAEVGEDVKNLAASQSRIHRVVHGLEDKFYSMERRLEDAAGQLSVANRGIHLLCNVVAENFHPSSNNTLYGELVDFTNSNRLVDVSASTAPVTAATPGLSLIINGTSSSTSGASSSTPIIRKPSRQGFPGLSMFSTQA